MTTYSVFDCFDLISFARNLLVGSTSLTCFDSNECSDNLAVRSDKVVAILLCLPF